MRLPVISACVAAALTATLALAQQPAEQKKAGPADDEKPAAGKTYVPGIEQFMAVMQSQHVKLWFAARANNWELAEFQVAEIKEVMGDIQDLYPKFKSMPFADMMDAVVIGPIADLEKVIESKDAKAFPAAFDKLTTACNGCHEAVGLGFVVIQRPVTNQFTNQNFNPRKK